jgi:hypothetical protein
VVLQHQAGEFTNQVLEFKRIQQRQQKAKQHYMT